MVLMEESSSTLKVILSRYWFKPNLMDLVDVLIVEFVEYTLIVLLHRTSVYVGLTLDYIVIRVCYIQHHFSATDPHCAYKVKGIF